MVYNIMLYEFNVFNIIFLFLCMLQHVLHQKFSLNCKRLKFFFKKAITYQFDFNF